MLHVFYTKDKTPHYEIIDGGCANINIKVGINAPRLLRIYVRDPSAANREQKLAQKLIDKIPIPQIYQIKEKFGYTFAIAEFSPGITLRDFLLHNKAPHIGQIMFEVDVMLNSISSMKFDKSGLLNNDLQITKTITQEDYIDFLKSTLMDDYVVSILSESERHQIDRIIVLYGHLLPDAEEKNLVHVDFDPSNILVEDVNGRMEISGILDWEFSFSGSTLCDVANMLRYKDYMPPEYEDAFLKGLSSKGFVCLKIGV